MSAGATNLLEVRDLVKYFPVRRGLMKKVVGHVRAVDGVSFEVRQGETLALVGESGSGKTTTGRLVLRLIEPTRGEVRFEGQDILTLNKESMRQLRRKMQIIFQDPQSSLNPRMKVSSIVSEPLIIHKVGDRQERAEQTTELLRLVGLDPAAGSKYPHEFSGGQRQRIGIARALALHPNFIVADEPISSLDVSIQAQILNLLMDLQEKLHLSYLFIAHDLRIVEHVSNRVAVMHLGRLVETAPTRELFANPAHPYTQALLASIPEPVPEKKSREVLEGEQPSPLNPPPGCHFHPRCPVVVDRCRREEPPLVDLGNDHKASCHLAS
jgi:oligopeptide/dipeptide ABC transporter ATP-binding protein